jgi:hypothetical protein
MGDILFLFNDWWYVLILISIMACTGIIHQYQLLTPVYNYFLRKFKNKKLIVTLISAIGGVLPVPGRVVISAGMLDTIATQDPTKRAKFGIINYLATHHYYMWSPLENTIIIPMAVLELTYLQVLSYTWPLLLISLAIMFIYIWMLKPDDVIINENIDKSETKLWYTYIKWKTAFFVLGVIMFSNLIKHNIGDIEEYMGFVAAHVTVLEFILTSVFIFGLSFAMGSSSKFAGITAIVTNILGLQYFTYIFAVEFAGYLLSPTHKCVAIGMSYFKTSVIQYYIPIIIWCICLVITGIGTLFF